MNRRLLLFVWSLAAVVSVPAFAVTCPVPVPNGVKCVKQGDPWTINLASPPPAAIHELIMEDNSTIVVEDLATWTVVVNKASFGKDSRILLLGRDGENGAGGSLEPGQSPYCRTGGIGDAGGDGTSGQASPGLRMAIAEFGTPPEGLTIELHPGEGGDGGRGGRGGKGGGANCFCDGGSGGPGGRPGRGGDGGSFGVVDILVPYLPNVFPNLAEEDIKAAARPLPNPCGPTGLCVPDATNGFKDKPLMAQLLKAYERFGFTLSPPMKLLPQPGISFRCLNKACDPNQRFDNGGEGGKRGSGGFGGESNCKGSWPETCFPGYCKGGGHGGADYPYDGAQGRPSSGPLPVLRVFSR